jgi:catechol 2,3-dioxygenase-like lactoylglutathione lyase family enzyme
MSDLSAERAPSLPPLLGRVRLQHVSIVIPPAAAAAARAFYGALLGLEERPVLPQLDPGSFIWYRVGEGAELHLMLAEEAARERAHFCLEVDDLEVLRRRLEDSSVETRDGTPIVGRPRFTCRDPFGNLIEFTTTAR